MAYTNFTKKTAAIAILVFVGIGCNFSNNKRFSSKIDKIVNIDSLKERLNTISERYNSIKQVSLKYSKYGWTHDGNDLMIYNQKWVAPLKYAIRIFERTPNDYIVEFEKENNIRIPIVYKEFLAEMNGCFIFGFHLFGLTPSIYESGLQDRSKVQCFDLGNANRNWISEYNIEENLFYFGSRNILI